MKRGKVLILIIVGILVGVGIILVAPLPYYQRESCLEMYPPRCYPARWYFKAHLWKELLGIPPETVSHVVQPSSTPSPIAETASWKTYTNTKYGIQFNYPSNLKPGKYTADSGVVLIADFSDDQNNDLQVWVALNGGIGHGGDFRMQQISNDGRVKVDGHNATLIISETDPSSSLYSAGDPILRRYSVVLDKTPVIIELTGEKAKTSIDQLNKILSTFKFTN